MINIHSLRGSFSLMMKGQRPRRNGWRIGLLLVLFLMLEPAFAKSMMHWPCWVWLQEKLIPSVQETLSPAKIAQGQAYLRKVYAEQLSLGKNFILPQARANALAVHWPHEQAFIDDFLPIIRNYLHRKYLLQDVAFTEILREAENNMLELAGGELFLTIKIFGQLEKEIDCLRLRSVEEVVEIRQRIHRLLLNLQDEQTTFWPNLAKRTVRWPNARDGHQFTLALRSFFLLAQHPMLVLYQQVKSDNWIKLEELMFGLENIEKYLATYPRFMANYLERLPSTATKFSLEEPAPAAAAE